MKIKFLTACLFCLPLTCLSQDFKGERLKMVKEQIANRGIKSEAVLTAMRKVERHKFVPPDLAPMAYIDSPLSIGEGQTISQPYIVAFMTEVLDLKKSEKILEIGTGSGYQAAILAELGCEVFSIEISEVLAKNAKKLLMDLDYKTISLRTGDGYQGWPENAPFDAIIVTCSPSHVPEKLQQQLEEGGRMIIPVGDRFTQELILLVKKNGKMKRESRLRVQFVPMHDEKGKKY
ncbi:MAG: protein-L-isoaspartate(D-aspartate) O-methyltransferase [Bacteroidota bacterium]